MAELYPGYAGKLLRVDLSTGKITEEHFGEAVLKQYVGGSGLGAKILYDEVPPEVKWSDAENRLIICVGPLSGTRVGGSGGFCAVTKGPLTNGAVTSQAQGYLGAYLRSNGYDGIIFQGAAPKLVYLHVGKNGVQLRDAARLSGKDTWETQDDLCRELGKTDRSLSVFSIGPAGENLVRFASLAGDRGHIAGHNGTGAVMGSKRLKAIAVERSDGHIGLHDAPRLSKLATEIMDGLVNDPGYETAKWGTSQGFGFSLRLGMLPVRNYTTNLFPEWERFMGERLRSTYEIKWSPCWACRFRHCHHMTVTEGPYAGCGGEEPEYEGMAGSGPLIGVTEPGAAVMLANEIDKLGLECNETGWVIAWVMECYERGLLTAKDLDGLEMRWGNAETTRKLLHKIAHREGVGNLLAEGVKHAAHQFGGEAVKCAIFTEKGSTPRGHDHRAMWGEMFDACVSGTGTIECGMVPFREEYGLPPKMDPFSGIDVSTTAGKGNGRFVFQDSLVVCKFTTQVPLAKIAELVNAATGWDFGVEECLSVGRRIVNLLRVHNLRCGITSAVERPSTRYSSTPIDGPNAGKSIVPQWDEMLRNYYGLMGWEQETGKPLPETLRRYGLQHTIPQIWSQAEVEAREGK